MNKKTINSLADEFAGKIADSSSERIRRRSIVSAVNFLSEVSANGNAEVVPAARKVLFALLRCCEDREDSAVIRLAALRGIRRILENLPDPVREKILPELTDPLKKVGRRRTDQPELLKKIRELVARLIEPTFTASSETRQLLETETIQCPHFLALQGKRKKLDELHAAITETITEILGQAVGYRPATRDEGVEIATSINDLATQFGLKLALPSTGELVALSFRKIGGANPGAFVFRIDDSTRYAGVTVPELHIRGRLS